MTTHWEHGVVRTSDVRRTTALAVLKVGGSLLSWAEWPRLIESLVAGMGDRPLTLVVGGGPVVDGLRAIDAAAPQPPEVMHELAIDGMHLMADLISRATGLPLHAEPRDDTAPCVLDVPVWLLGQAGAADLPAGWDVTSDSIAARVARAYDADLVLAKSVPPPATWCGESLFTLAQAGWVDRFFPSAAADLDHIAWAAPRKR